MRYVAVQPIPFGSVLAFAPGAVVPEDHVERFGYLNAGLVAAVPDGEPIPAIEPFEPDNTPPDLTPERFIDPAMRQVEEAQRAFIAEQRAQAEPAPAPAPEFFADVELPAEPEPSDVDTVDLPDTGDTNTDQPVTSED